VGNNIRPIRRKSTFSFIIVIIFVQMFSIDSETLIIQKVSKFLEFSIFFITFAPFFELSVKKQLIFFVYLIIDSN